LNGDFSSLLLPSFPHIPRCRVFATAPERIDVQPAATGVAGIYGQRFGLAVFKDVTINPLDALLVKLVVVAE
jgi:hypothetical protein